MKFYLAHEIDLTVSLKTMSLIPYEQWLTEVKNADYILTVLAPELDTADVEAVSQLIAEQGLNIESMARLTGLVVSEVQENALQRVCMNFTLTGQITDAQATRQACLNLSQQRNIDVALQDSAVYGQPRRLICFDMDSTLIGQEVIDELAKEAGVGEQVAEITERAMQGELPCACRTFKRDGCICTSKYC
jgi:phosphoserine phosphatase